MVRWQAQRLLDALWSASLEHFQMQSGPEGQLTSGRSLSSGSRENRERKDKAYSMLYQCKLAITVHVVQMQRC